ncbi:MAG: hypothetical protein LBM94_05105 [Propionibacteriaceae bacterium]|jgi:hypothetical protein|nr:hypothetical protein [Propionibacteriaceae bacterium]
MIANEMTLYYAVPLPIGAAWLVAGIDDLRALEELEMAADITAFDHAKSEDDGYRTWLGQWHAT